MCSGPHPPALPTRPEFRCLANADLSSVQPLSGYRLMAPVARSMAARTVGSGPKTVSLLASLIAPGTVLPGTYAGSSAISGRRRAVISTAYVWPVYAVLRGGPGSPAVLDGQVSRRPVARPASSSERGPVLPD